MAGNTARRNVLLVAALLGLTTSLLIYRFLQSVKATSQASQVAVVVASREIQPRTIIDPSMIETKLVPRSMLPVGVLTQRSDAIGRVALVRLPPDAPLSDENVGIKSAALGLAYVIPSSMRAVTVAVDPVIGVAGFLKPGDHVDVVATFSQYNDYSVVKTVLQDIELVALGSQVQKDDARKNSSNSVMNNGKDTATLLVTPQDAEKLVLADSRGKLRLVLRSAGDLARSDTPGISSDDVAGKAPVQNTGQASVQMTKPTPKPAPKITQAKAPVQSHPHAGKLPAFRMPAPVFASSVAPLPTFTVPAKIEDNEPKTNTTTGHEIEVIRGTQVEKVTVDATNNAK